MDKGDNGDIKEDFCPACIIAPLALMGAGGAVASGMGSKDKLKKKKQLLFWMSIGTIALSLLILIFWLIFRKKCTGCAF